MSRSKRTTFYGQLHGLSTLSSGSNNEVTRTADHVRAASRFIIKFIWWILGAAALIGSFYVVRAIVRTDRAAREAYAKYQAQIAARADQQHRWVLEGDDRGIYGPYPVSDIIKELRRGIEL